jgi:hypothetical protein
VFPRERFYLIANDGRLLQLTLGDDAGGEEPGSAWSEPPLLIEPLYDIQPPLLPGEIVSVCGCGDVIVRLFPHLFIFTSGAPFLSLSFTFSCLFLHLFSRARFPPSSGDDVLHCVLTPAPAPNPAPHDSFYVVCRHKCVTIILHPA